MDNSLEQLISEDLTNYGKGGQGYDWHNQSSTNKVSLVDVLTQQRGDGDSGQAGRLLPYEINTISDRIVTQFDNNVYIKSDFVQALKNPIISDDEHSKEAITTIIEYLTKLNEGYTEIIKELDKLTV